MERVHAITIDQDCFDPREIKKAEEEALAKRVAEESGPVITRKPTPVECVKAGISLEKAQQMKPEDLSPEEARVLASYGVKLTTIGQLYGFSGNQIYIKMHNWGIKKAQGVPEYPCSTVTKTKQLTEAEKEDLFGNQFSPEPDHPRLIPVTENQKNYQKAIDAATETPIIAQAPEDVKPSFDLSEFEEAVVRCNLGGSWLRVRPTKDSANSGELDFSKTLFSSVAGQRYRLRVNTSGDTILLQPDQDGPYRISEKQAKAPSGNVVALLRERGVKLPARYLVEKQGEMLVGRLENA